jgi:ADP-heptose:LPS heptosyltransferase
MVIDTEVDQWTDLDGFAAQVAAMDLVVTIDNSTAHMAAALGVQTWTMLPFAPDWRWLLERENSPWYPTMRLFRQREPGQWKPVIEEVALAIASNVLRR